MNLTLLLLVLVVLLLCDIVFIAVLYYFLIGVVDVFVSDIMIRVIITTLLFFC